MRRNKSPVKAEAFTGGGSIRLHDFHHFQEGIQEDFDHGRIRTVSTFDDGGWIMTLCEKHRQEQIERREKIEKERANVPG